MNLRLVSRGLFLVFLGAVFLLVNLGYVSWSFWWAAFTWWPVALIVLGLGLMLGRRLPLTLVLTVLGVILVAVSILRPAQPPVWFVPWTWERAETVQRGTVDLDQPLPPGVDTARVRISVGGAQVGLGAGAKGLLEGRVSYGWFRPELQATQSGREMVLTLSGDPRGRVDGLFGSGRRSFGPDTWELHLNPAVSYDLDFSGGAVRGDFDLSRLRINRLHVSTGASDLRLTFGDTGTHSRINLDAGASRVVLVVPPGAGCQVKASGALLNKNFGGRGLLVGDTYTSENYRTAATTLDINVSAGATDLRIEAPASPAVQ